jgi:hypothetical protein
MIDENSEIKYAACNLCGQERACFVQYEFGEEKIVCPACLRMIDCY